MRVAPSSLLTTQYPGHARELAATAAAQGIDTVIVIGGTSQRAWEFLSICRKRAG
jgi:hypothetical protein